jgi:putative Ca2+/H+ antiporter (TMEM165/GDT1 family)
VQSLSAPSSTAETTLNLLEASLSQPQTAVTTLVSEEISVSLLSEARLTEAELRQPIVAQDGAAKATHEEAPAWKLHLQVFTSTFLTIFLAELGDKTQVTTLLMAAESHSPWIVFAGAGAALVATSAIGVWLGCWLAKRVSPQVLERSVGIILLGVSALLVWDVFQG